MSKSEVWEMPQPHSRKEVPCTDQVIREAPGCIDRRTDHPA